MSRCFPYTAQIYKKEDVTPIGSIKKLQNGWGNIKQRKDLSLYMKEKPIKKRFRDEHDKLNSCEHKNKRRRNEEKKAKFTESCHDARKYDSEHLERSDLSEEHNPPSFVLSHCSSLQVKSSQKNGAQVPDPGKKRPGMVLRLKLPSKKSKDQKLLSTSTDPCSTQLSNSSKLQASFTLSTPRPSETSSVKQPLSASEEPCFSGRVPIPQLPNETSSVKQPFPASEEPCFSGRADEVPISQLQDGIIEAEPSESRHRRGSHKHKHHTPKSERHFRELIVNWKPPSLQLNESDDESPDWLFAPRRQSKDVKSTAQISKATISEPSPCSILTDSLQVRACFLPEYGMYQLPYVIPF